MCTNIIYTYIRRAKNLRLLGITAFSVLFLLTLLSIFPIVNHKESAEASYNPATSTLAIVSSKDTASVDVTPTSAAGTFVISDAADQAEFTVATTNLTGYSLNILGTDTSGQLVNATTGDTLDTLSADTDEGTFRNGSADSYANKWGYRLNINSTTTTDFMAAPTTDTAKTIYTTNAPNAPATSDNYTLGIGARVDYEKPYGTYTNTFVLTAVGNPISYQINYLDNTGPGGATGSDVSNLPASEGQSNITASAFTLSSTTPTRTGYGFIGWCYGTVNHTVDPSTCTGTTYQAGENFSFTSMPSTGTAEADLYAMWEFKPPLLYDAIAGMSKGTQTAADLQAAITVPTSADRTLDTSNSGVYEYSSSVFGAATDASNTYKIYYYRGVLENSVGSYGSDGSAVTYPNYVKLGNTCWRILRTTGSGGVKMIYNGTWTGTTCANSTTNAQIGENTFSVDSNKYYGSALGYTQNGFYSESNLSAIYSTMFGTNTSFSVNSTDSGIKTYIEDWYNNTSGIKATYGSHLEADAGYCNDRTLNSGTSWTTPMADSTTVNASTTYYAGAYIRNLTTTKNPSLTCSRNNADVYSTSTATTGNKQLSQPIALITADEASFAGSGRSNGVQGLSYHHANSFLRSGSSFWLLSPLVRNSYDNAGVFTLYSDGYLDGSFVDFPFGVRPAISLSQGAIISSGTGIATDPWEVRW